MSDEAYNKKLADLQKYIPFMENMITQLKDPKWKPREAQLNKMESLYNMITDRNKKWKYETLLKCEEVIMKLQNKVKANKPIFPAGRKDKYVNSDRSDTVSSTVSDIMNALKFNNARVKLNCEMSTPKSPSPIREAVPQHSPKIIPFEAMNEPIRKSTNIIDPNELSVTWNCDREDRYVNEKPDIYSSAAKSLGVTLPVKVSIFDRLGPVVPDAASDKPLLSDADLEMLRTGDDLVVICQNDQVREPPKQETSLQDINLKITPRITPVPASKPKTNVTDNVDKGEVLKAAKKTEKTKDDKRKDNKSSSSGSGKSQKTEKIVTSDIFGSCLSSIDNKILEDSKKKDKKKDERRHSTEHKKEKHHHESKHHHHKHKDKDKKKEDNKIEDPRLNIDKEKKQNISIEKPIEKSDAKEKPPEEKPQIITEVQPEKPKRLADKYNPKPRKHVETASEKLPENVPEKVPDKITNDVPFEIRDPRKRPGLFPTPPSILGSPQFAQPLIPNHNSFSVNNSRNVTPNISAATSHLPASLQQIIPPPKPIPLMTLNVSNPRGFQSPPLQQPWLNDNTDYARPNPGPIFEPPIKPTDPRRQSFLDNPDRSMGEIRRQPKFSPPPPMSPVHTGYVNNFVPPAFHSQPAALLNELNFVPPPQIQRNLFELSAPQFQQNRFEGHLNRYDMPMNNSHVNPNILHRKSFCPFEPLDSGRLMEDDTSPLYNTNIFQNDSSRRNDNLHGGFRSNFNQYNNRQDNRFDRYGRKPSREMPKSGQREDMFSKERKFPAKEDPKIKTEDEKQKLQYKDSDSDLSIKEQSHTKYDEIYSKLDSEKETFSSPLESLYSNSKTSVKSIQSFKIPKKPKPEPPPAPPSPPASLLEEQKPKEHYFDKTDELQDDVKPIIVEETLDTLKTENSIKENEESKSKNVPEDTDSEDDDVPLCKRVKRRTKTIPKNKVIDDSDEEEESETDVKEEEIIEEVKEEEPVPTRRVTRQSAIKANKLIVKRTTRRRRKVQKAKPKPKINQANAPNEKLGENIEEKTETLVSEMKNDVKSETVDIQSKEELIQDDKDLANIEIDTKEQVEMNTNNKTDSNVLEDIKPKKEEENLPQKEEKEPNEVQKAKEELLTEAKKKNLNLNDQGAEVLQFILMNYKKIKKIFRSDSSSDEEEKERKKKKKRRDKSSSDDEKDSKEKRKHKEKHSSDDEKETKEKKKQKEKQSFEEHVDEKEKLKAEEKPKSEDEESKESNAKEECLDDNESVTKEEKLSDEKIDAMEPIEENIIENVNSVKEGEDEKVELKRPVKRQIRKASSPKGRPVRPKIQARVAAKQVLVSPTKKARRSELDKLHDDIKEMLMGGEVLTSTGKRACTMPKDDSEELRKDWYEDVSSSGLDQNAIAIPTKNVRVLIEKTDIEKLLLKEPVKEDVTDKQESIENTVDMPKLEKMVSTPIRKMGKKKILRKKKHRWATGFLKRKNKRKNSSSEDKIENEDVSPIIRGKIAVNRLLPQTKILHDKSYFVQDAKPSCKLCPFKGKLIIQHYKSAHPDAEVLISRMDPTVTEHLIKEAKENNYNSIVLKEVPSQKKKRFGYKCPFMCPIGTTMDFCENYFDHITSHTGEYRFFCPYCPFSTSNSRNLRGHMVTQHNSNLENYGKAMTPAPPSSKYVFGYVCRQCHFVQTRRERLEKHLADYHNNKGEIIKVNLSLVCMEIEEVVDSRALVTSEVIATTKKIFSKQDHINESIESVVNGAGMIKTPEPSLVKDLNIFDLIKQIEADEPPVLVKMEPIDEEPDIETLLMPEINIIEGPPAQTNQADLTVFMCKSDLPVDDEQTIEQKRLKKMNEIHENVKPSRTSIVDKLQSRLDSTAQEDIPFTMPATITALASSSSIVVNSLKPPPLIPLDRSKKSLDSIPKNVIPPEVVMAPKKAAPISNIINRLQDKLLPIPSTSKQACVGDQEETNSTLSSTFSSPLSSPSKQSDTNLVSSALNVGPITITFNQKSEILYSCFVPFCVFNTTEANVFEHHCKMTHQDFIYDHMKCDVCQVKIEHEDDFVSMLDIYNHINTGHADFFNRTTRNEENTGAPNGELTSASENSLTMSEDTTADDANTIPQTDNSGAKYPFVITNVTSVDPQASTSTEPEKFPKFTLPHDVPNLISQAEDTSGPKFPFIITSVTSLAKKPQTPTLAISLQNTTTTSTPTPTLLNSLATNVPIVSTILTLSPVSATPIQTSPTMKPYTITSAQPIPAMVPIILNPLAPQNEMANKIQLPVISCVQSLAPPKKDTIRPVPLNQLTSDSWTSHTNSIPDKRPVSLNQIPTGNLTIQSCTSLEKRAPSNIITVVSLISSDGKTLTLKDIPMTTEEKMAPRKSKKARDVLLQSENVAHFYKCPQFDCSYSSDKPQDYLSHLSIHKDLTNKCTYCLHCDYKTSYKLYMVHLEVHHGGCDYSCGRCFYRTTNAAFVTAHSKLRHKEDPIVIQTPREKVPPKINNPKVSPLQSLLKHYVCGAPGCNLMTIFSNVYYEHITTAHPSLKEITCGICKSSLASLSIHWATHNVFPYHCRYCKMGSRSLAEVVTHQSTLHFKNDYCVISRRFVPNPIYPERPASSYDVTDPATYDRLYIIYGGNGADSVPIEEDNLFELPIAPKANENANQSQPSDIDPIFLNVDITEENQKALQEKVLDESAKDGNIDTDMNASADEPEIPLINTDLDEAVTDPLSFDTASLSDDDAIDDRDVEADTSNYDPKAPKHSEEYSGAMLYKCICNMGFEDRGKFKSHIVACQAENNYKCVHCGLVRKSIRTLLTHMQDHGRLRFKCSLCQYKHFAKKFVRDHMVLEHNVHETMLLPATVTKKIDYNKDDFVLRPKLAPVKKIASAPVQVEVPAVNKTRFFPQDMQQLPRPPIYQTEVFCGVCNYATKVKSNMVRHLQAHQNEQEVPGTAPVNPVPCLEKSEKMFDKMVNLALSSHSGGKMGTPKVEKQTSTEETNIPTFIPTGKRFVCGAESCNYLCPEEGMLRRHLTAFHSQELNYTCLHCNTKLFEGKLINLDMILKHLKLHDAHLYSCGYCTFLHNLKHKVERHLVDKHSDKPPTYVVIREVVKEAGKEGAPSGEKDDGKKPWRCGMCKFMCANIEEVISHTQVKHNVNSKHKCSLCEYGSEEIDSFGKHFETNHSGKTVDMIVTYYKEEEVTQPKPEADPEFNTTPLWQRNKSVKHIRGILLEETNNKMPKTPGPKKLKPIKPKKVENVESTVEIGTDLLPLIINAHAAPPKTGETKKPPPKRRKSSIGNKATPLSKKTDKTVNTGKDVTGDLISSNISVGTSDIINDIAKSNQHKDEISIVKQTPIVVSTKNVINNTPVSEVIISNDNSNAKISNDTKQKAKILSVSYFKVDSNDPNSIPSQNSQKKAQTLKTYSKIPEDFIERLNDKTKNSESAVKKDNLKSKPPQLSIPSTEETDVIEIGDDLTPPAEITPKRLDDAKRKTQDADIIDISDDKFENSNIPNKKLNIEKITNTSIDKIGRGPSPAPNKKFKAGKSSILTVHLTSAPKTSNKKDFVVIEPLNKPKKTVKAKTDFSMMLPVTCKINLDDSSAEDSDVIEITNESDPLKQCDSAQALECTVTEDVEQTKDPLTLNPNLDSTLKNIKVVSVCSLKDTISKDVEEIEDDGDIELIEDDGQAPSKKLKSDISINEIESMSKMELINGNFVGTYGPYGAPWQGSYKCPLCEKFVCVSSKVFTAHMHGELQYGVYKCAVCAFRDDDESAVVRHCEESHENIDTQNMVLAAPDQQIVDWVAKLLVFQTRILALDRDEVRCYCHFCDYKCDNPSDMRKHQVRHWCIKPFTCTACKYETVSKSSLDRHLKRCHPGANIKGTESDVGESVVIKRIRWNGRTEKPEDGTETFETFEMDSNLDEIKDVLLSCCYCTTRGKLNELRTHISLEHPQEEFKVHRYRCCYCSSTFTSIRTLDQHFMSCHSGMHRNYTEVSDVIKVYRCPQCPVSHDKFATIKDHVRSHYKTLKCLHCDVTTVYWKTMKKHYHTEHPTQNFEFLYLLWVEQCYEKNLIHIKVAPSISSSNSSGTSNAGKKRKRLDEDVVIIENSPTRSVLDETTNRIEAVPSPKTKQVARKSTGYVKPKEIESHYGKRPNIDDFANIITTVDVMGAPVTMNIIKLAKIFDISPIVLIKDCENDL